MNRSSKGTAKSIGNGQSIHVRYRNAVCVIVEVILKVMVSGMSSSSSSSPRVMYLKVAWIRPSSSLNNVPVSHTIQEPYTVFSQAFEHRQSSIMILFGVKFIGSFIPTLPKSSF